MAKGDKKKAPTTSGLEHTLTLPKVKETKNYVSFGQPRVEGAAAPEYIASVYLPLKFKDLESVTVTIKAS